MLGERLMRLRKRQGYSQQEVADKLAVTRQTISNWECNQAMPSIDKALELARLYNLSLDDLMENEIEIVSQKTNNKDLHLLQYLINKKCILECYDDSLLIDLSGDGEVTVIDVNDDWIKVQYQRVQKKSILKKETVIKLIDLSCIKGFKMEVDL